MGRSAVIIKSNPYGLILNLSAELPFEELLDAVGEKFRESADFFKDAKIALTFRGRTLTVEEENRLADVITENSQLRVLCIVDEDKAAEEKYRRAVTHALEEKKEEEGQFYRGTMRSGQSLETEKSIVILGDVNPGAQVTSRGSIVVLGCCMGNLYAGAGGDTSCFAAALTMKPMQIRIANKTARSAIVRHAPSAEFPPDPKIVFLRDGHLQIKPISGETVNEYLA